MAAERIGILGGTFDPVHVGHLFAAVAARDVLGLDRVLLVVANEPWQKVGSRSVTPAAARLAVVEAAIGGVAGLEASRLELDREGPSYTFDTVDQLASEQPGAELFLVVGSDILPDLPTWHRVDELRERVVLAVVDRAGDRSTPDPPGWAVTRIAMPALEVSSSDLRDRLAKGQPVDFLIPDKAIRCIRSLGLYALSR
ncbi:MAG TPA: nicotinate-nucleotide adenylyltransferase [Acidimicrobiales bacterium]|nr:nicotinate-nucleotide adenylyltransferase [Acidimicrobiales bacterium]